MEKEAQSLQLKRTSWTLPMDRYFVKLMLEQVNAGQRVDGNFSKEAWKRMADQFSAKFGPTHNIEVLKNHYRALKRNHAAIKALLKEDGFCWDSSKEMLEADDTVWDDHIKAHREVQIWRTKSVPGYDDLCIIFGNGGATEKYSLAPTDDDLSKEKTSMKNGEHVNFTSLGDEGATTMTREKDLSKDKDSVEHREHMDLQQSSSPIIGSEETFYDTPEPISCGSDLEGTEKEVQNLQLKRTIWTLPMDRYFIKLMLEQVHAGQHFDGHFSKDAWKCMADQFSAKFGPTHNVEVLKNHYRALRRHHTSISALLKENGFRWDSSREMLEADDNVWDEYVKARREVQMWRTKSVPGYEDLCMIFGDVGAAGKCSLTSGDNDSSKEKTSTNDGVYLNVQCGDLSPSVSNGGVTGGYSLAPGDKDSSKEKSNMKSWEHMTAQDDDFCTSIGNELTTGRNSLATRDKDPGKEKASMNNQEHAVVQQFTSPIVGSEDPSYETQEPISLDSDYEVLNQSKRSQSTLPSNSRNTKKSRRSMEEDIMDAIPGMVSAIQGMASAIQGMASTITIMTNNKKECRHPTSNAIHLGKLIAALEAVPEIDNFTCMRALDFLEDEKKAKIFMELGVERRREWLLYNLKKL